MHLHIIPTTSILQYISPHSRRGIKFYTIIILGILPPKIKHLRSPSDIGSQHRVSAVAELVRGDRAQAETGRWTEAPSPAESTVNFGAGGFLRHFAVDGGKLR